MDREISPLTPHDVFISHSSKDNAVTTRIFDQLRQADIDAWLDFHSIKPGQDWRASIETALENCACGLLVLSEHSIKSQECLAEWNKILTLKKPLFVVKVDQTSLVKIPARLSILQIVDLTGAIEQPLQAVIAAIRKILPEKQPQPAAAIAPERVHGDPVAGLIDTTENLPVAPPDYLVGRDEVLNEVLTLLRQHKPVLLQGFPGVGKTACALTIAARWLAIGESAALWLRAGDSSAEAIFHALLRRLNEEVPYSGQIESDQRQILLRCLTEHHIGLIVLDDVWNASGLVQIARMLPAAVALLVTSRNRYPLESGVIKELDVLKTEDALKLLKHTSGRSDVDDASARHLCQQLGVLPFAVEIAGRLLKMRPAWSAADLSGYWEDQLYQMQDSLNFTESHQQNLTALLQVSLDAIQKENPAARTAFFALGALFQPSLTEELATYLLYGDTADKQARRRTAAALLTLHDHGLIHLSRFSRLDGGHILYYRMHKLAYDYAHDNTALDENGALLACAAYIRQHKTDFDELDVEQGNLFAALAAADQQEKMDLRDAMLWSLTVEGSYFASRGIPPALLVLLERAAARAEQRQEIEHAHYLWSKIGNLQADLMQNLAAALAAYENALRLAQQIPDPQRESILLIVLGRLRYADVDERITFYNQVAAENPDEMVRAWMSNHLGYLECEERHNYEKGYLHFTEQVRIAEKLLADSPQPGKDLIQFYIGALQCRGTCEHDMGRYEDALQSHQAACKQARQHNMLHGIGNALQMIGEDYHALAQQSLNEALRIFQQANAAGDAQQVRDYMLAHHYDLVIEQPDDIPAG